ncbi:hypothetical protein BDQ17DRAFT_1425612 [Cyathus striatus]|nr:hypothetical protein BDQ17DRAFT_1425612 [Cyathus striatus]
MVSTTTFWLIIATVLSAGVTSMANILEAGRYHIQNHGQDHDSFVGRDPRQEGYGHDQKIVSLRRNDGDKFLEWTVEYNSKDGGHHLRNGNTDTDAKDDHIYVVARGYDGKAWRLRRADGDDYDDNDPRKNAFTIEGDDGKGWVLRDNKRYSAVEYKKLSRDDYGHDQRDEELWEFHRIDKQD